MTEYTLTETINGVTYEGIEPKIRIDDMTTEDLLYADELEDGMRVLIEPKQRVDEESYMQKNELIVFNRWCTVAKIRVDENSVTFIGVYDDGSKTIRRSSNTTGWVVKKDSIPVHDDPEPSSEEATGDFGDYIIQNHMDR